MKKNIILTGSLSFDYIFDIDDSFSNYILPEKIHKINFSFVIDNHHKSFGGTAANQAFYLARLDQNPYIFATGGYDFADFNKFLMKNRVRTDFIHIADDLPTGTGFVITDKKDNQIWMYSKGAMKNNSSLKLKAVYTSSERSESRSSRSRQTRQPRSTWQARTINNLFVVISPNDPQAVINLVNECEKEKVEFVFDPAFYIPTLPYETLMQGVKNAKIIFGNDYEIAFIEKRLKKKITDIVNNSQVVVKTLGDQGSEIYYNRKWIKVGIYKTKTIDPTGAGDAYRAGFLYGYLHDMPLKTCGWMGAVTASFAVEVKGTMNLKFNRRAFDLRMKNVKFQSSNVKSNPKSK